MDKDRLLATFLDLVQIDAPSLGEADVAAYCVRALEEAGCDVVVDATAASTGSNTGNVIATLPGTLPGKVFFDAHMDCVEPCRGIKPRIEDGIVRSDGTTVLGGDDKVGVAAVIELMRTLAADGREHPTVVGILTVGEEIGLLGARSVDPALFDGEPCFVLDDSQAPGTVTIGAPSQFSFTARFTGRAAHAGVAPEQGISAIEMASAAVSAMELGRLDEVRDAMQHAMETAAEVHGGSVEVDWRFEYDGFLADEDDPTVRLVAAAAADCGLAYASAVSGGASDANVLGAKGCKPFVLGTGMTGFHTTAETIAVADIEDTCRLALAIAERVGAGE